MDADERAMFVDALPKQRRMLVQSGCLVLPFFRQRGLACAFRIPIGDESEHVKRLVGAPDDYEFTCFLAIGHAAGLTPPFRQKVVRAAERIHRNVW